MVSIRQHIFKPHNIMFYLFEFSRTGLLVPVVDIVGKSSSTGLTHTLSLVVLLNNSAVTRTSNDDLLAPVPLLLILAPA